METFNIIIYITAVVTIFAILAIVYEYLASKNLEYENITATIVLLIESSYIRFNDKKITKDELARKIYENILSAIDIDKVKLVTGLTDEGVKNFVAGLIIQYLEQTM